MLKTNVLLLSGVLFNNDKFVAMDNKYDRDKKASQEETDRLSDLKLGDSAVINGITADCDNHVRQRLLDLGFVKGAD